MLYHDRPSGFFGVFSTPKNVAWTHLTGVSGNSECYFVSFWSKMLEFLCSVTSCLNASPLLFASAITVVISSSAYPEVLLMSTFRTDLDPICEDAKDAYGVLEVSH